MSSGDGDADGGRFVDPAYGESSLADVLPAVARALGAPLDDHLGAGAGESGEPGLVLPGAGSYVVLLVDGLGRQLLAAHPDDAPYLSSLLPGSATATAGVPSTTATSITSLGTGAPPGAHGVLGYTTRIPGTDDLLNALKWSKQVDPEQYQPRTTAFARIAAAGVHTTVVNKRDFAGTGLTVASCRGAEFVGVERWGERLVAVQAASQDAPSLVYTYDGDLDWTGHRYGVCSPQWRAQLTMVDLAAQRLRESLPQHVRLLVVADHGMVDVGPGDRLDVDREPGMRDGVALIGGEARFRHVYCRPGAADDVAAAWQGTLAEGAEVLVADDAVARGWFGSVDPALRARIGDVVVACRGTRAVLSSKAFPLEGRLIGMHGSLTLAEMSIPVLVG